MMAAGKKNRLKMKYPTKLCPFRPATRAGQNAIAIQTSAITIHQKTDMVATSPRLHRDAVLCLCHRHRDCVCCKYQRVQHSHLRGVAPGSNVPSPGAGRFTTDVRHHMGGMSSRGLGTRTAAAVKQACRRGRGGRGSAVDVGPVAVALGRAVWASSGVLWASVRCGLAAEPGQLGPESGHGAGLSAMGGALTWPTRGTDPFCCKRPAGGLTLRPCRVMAGPR